MARTAKTIRIRVTQDAARTYESASAEERRKLDALLSLKLSEIRRNKRSLEEIMDEISSKAESRGLTPDILDSLLNDE